jgi:hypothetical protein
MPFICLRRTDIPNSTLQVTDLWPNKSQSNPSIDPYPQGPRYVSQPAAPALATLVTGPLATKTFGVAQSGLSAFLLVNAKVAAGAPNPALTPAQALLCANALVTEMRLGNALGLAQINAAMAAVVANAALQGVATSVVPDLLRVLSGATYTVPAGTVIQSGAGAWVAQGSPAAFNAACYDFSTYVDVNVADSSFYISLAQGKLNGFTSSAFSYKGTTGAALVVYDNAGAVI